MEGIRFVWGNLTITGKFEKAYFLKCHFKQIFWQTTSTNRGNYKICNCKILAFSHSNNSKINFINSYVESYNCNSSNDSEALFFNCLMNGIYSPLKRASLINCILNTNSYHSLHYRTKLDSSCKAMNCLSVNNDPDFFGNLYSAAVNCSCIDDYSKVFKTYNGTDSDSETFELTDEAKTTYLGTDGTEIGLYGGDLPFNTTPSYPQITKMNVANKTTADGKLSVEIEVSAAE